MTKKSSKLSNRVLNFGAIPSRDTLCFFTVFSASQLNKNTQLKSDSKTGKGKQNYKQIGTLSDRLSSDRH